MAAAAPENRFVRKRLWGKDLLLVWGEKGNSSPELINPPRDTDEGFVFSWGRDLS